jgi:hypothetical protein
MSAVLNGTCARTSIGRLGIFSEAVTTHASPTGRLAGSKFAAAMPMIHKPAAQTAAAHMLGMNASPDDVEVDHHLLLWLAQDTLCVVINTSPDGYAFVPN